MRAETLQARPAAVPRAPGVELFPQILNLFPKQSRRAVTASRLQFDDRCCHFDHSGIEVDRAARRELERAARARNNPAPDEILRRSENCFRTPLHVVDEKGEFRFQADDRPRRRKMILRTNLGSILYTSLHSRGTR